MCKKTFDDPRTLPCLHSFCLGCLEAQEFTAKSKFSGLSCHQCKAPFTLPDIGGVGAYTCSVFVDSLVKSAKATQGDINGVVKCDGCGEEDATMHCVDCNEHIGPSCLVPHRKMKATASHQQIPVEEARAGNATVKRIPRCQKHIGSEVDTYCETCNDSVCLKCLGEKHSGHTFCPLSQVTWMVPSTRLRSTAAPLRRRLLPLFLLSTLRSMPVVLSWFRRCRPKETS